MVDLTTPLIAFITEEVSTEEAWPGSCHLICSTLYLIFKVSLLWACSTRSLGLSRTVLYSAIIYKRNDVHRIMVCFWRIRIGISSVLRELPNLGYVSAICVCRSEASIVHLPDASLTTSRSSNQCWSRRRRYSRRLVLRLRRDGNRSGFGKILGNSVEYA